MKSKYLLVSLFFFSILNGQREIEELSQDNLFEEYEKSVIGDEIYKKNISENGIEDVYTHNYGELLNLFGRDSIGVVDDDDPYIGVVDDPDVPETPIDSYQIILLILATGYIYYLKNRN